MTMMLLQRTMFGSQIRCYAVLLLGLFLAGCATPETPNLLDARGPAAVDIADLWWFIFWLALAVFIAVLVLSGIALYHARRGHADAPEPFAARPAFLILSGVIVPGIILVALLVVSMRSSHVLTAEPTEQMLTIEVIGHQWWWEVRYPDYGIVTANEIHMPVGEPVNFMVTSRDVIHSFWVPQLHGKIDMIDGKNHSTIIEATEPGVYKGICAEFCGLQHTFMLFELIAQDQASFGEWVAQQQRVPPLPVGDEQLWGQEIFVSARCDQCHAIQDHTRLPLPDVDRTGPDLTHFASRRTLAAGRIENTPANLAAWILDPHALKPGVHMPPTLLPGDELNALVAYLMSLE
jgi:cytochrome c oxidase subunit II